jgi:signal transduction histidine kinase
MIIGIILAVFIAAAIFLFNRKIQQNNRQLNKLNFTKDKLFSIISHDLKGPIGSTLGLSEILLKKFEDKPESINKKMLLALYEGLNQTNNLLTNLLQWALTQIKGISYSPEALSMNSIVKNAIKPIANEAERKHIKVSVEIEETMSVWADINMLNGILQNLITNAIKFTNENGSILVNAIQRKNQIQVCIRDNGIGMSPETLNNLFSLDKNSSTRGTSGEKGTGLGLILCKEFVEIHKGELWVESTLNEGSSFYFTIPCKD